MLSAQPSPSLPSRRSAGTRTSSKKTSLYRSVALDMSMIGPPQPGLSMSTGFRQALVLGQVGLGAGTSTPTFCLVRSDVQILWP